MVVLKDKVRIIMFENTFSATFECLANILLCGQKKAFNSINYLLIEVINNIFTFMLDKIHVKSSEITLSMTAARYKIT